MPMLSMKSASYNTVQQKMLDGGGAAILNEFGKNRSLPPDSVEVQELVKKWQAYITDNYYNCTKEILSCLGQMYVGDERFTQHIDQYGVGSFYGGGNRSLHKLKARSL